MTRTTITDQNGPSDIAGVFKVMSISISALEEGEVDTAYMTKLAKLATAEIISSKVYGVPPFWEESENEIFEEVLRGKLDFSSDPRPSISESAKDLVRKMLIKDPKRRIIAHGVLSTQIESALECSRELAPENCQCTETKKMSNL
ncbi:unnamed protein product [Lactuca saligna]|uniref:Protein kinase domain-containing protein n=1 Tax=Lactuca saligna TaxID=75948 RepID=A0AA36EJS6_LACSI|nr:unnamed protein product [Lactuca saligna]